MKTKTNLKAGCREELPKESWGADSKGWK